MIRNTMQLSNKLDNFSYVSVYGTEENGFIIKQVILKSVANFLPKDTSVDIALYDENEFEYKHEHKFDSSVYRARSRIWELAMCNSWEYFFTITLDPQKYDRFDLDKFHKDFTKYLYEYKHRKYKLRFLIIPEKHVSGAWHFHGLLGGLPEAELTQFKLGMKMSSVIAGLVGRGRIIFFSPPIQSKFGYNTFEKIDNKQAVAKYVTKYIQKDISKSVSKVGGHVYYHSRGLNGKTEIIQGSVFRGCSVPFKTCYENEKVIVKEWDYSPETLEKLMSCFNYEGQGSAF